MKVAVVGSGVSGLAATWLLNEHSDHEVHLYESDSRPGGHANTVHFVPNDRHGSGIDVDTGFIVLNPTTYPNFLRFLRSFSPRLAKTKRPSRKFSFNQVPSDNSINEDAGIEVVETEMTFSVTRDGGVFEWAGKNLRTVFCQPHRLLDPQMWRMLYDVLRFNACARKILVDEQSVQLSIGEYLDREGYSSVFRNNYLIPMTAAIWSTPPGDCFLSFPAKTLIQFLYNHNLLQITGKPSWLTIKGGSHQYVKKILSNLPPDQLHLSTPIKSVQSISTSDGQKPKVVLTTDGDEEHTYDHVILACHSDTALNILRAGGELTDDEERILGKFQWSHNEVVLHSDEQLMPRSRLAWSCWNYLSFTKPEASATALESKNHSDMAEVNRVSLTYGMNDLQHIPEAKYGPVLVTLNPPFEPDPSKTVGKWHYSHPVLDSQAVQAQKEMLKIQNTRSISYAGAYLKYGFHEDGFTSGLLAACSLDKGQEKLPAITSNTAPLPNEIISTNNITVRPPFEIKHADHHTRLRNSGATFVFYSVVAFLFEIFEGSGLREFFALSGSVILTAVGRLVHLQDEVRSDIKLK
ncbi:amine oxidase [Crepidotus variabilis]|uniref:Amine oxidase n=1 Tax=Crepidotus variabilis TaxID=179855 RepID=A0A9P6JKH0_9AGAR|nr:amine oxidase [Crepidotus variabilis]